MRPAIYDRSFNARDFWVLLGLIALLIAYRLITPEMIESGGDAIAKWWLARRAHDESLAVMGNEHHGARLGINLVAYLVQRILGTHPVVYYVPAYLMSVIQVVFLYLIIRRETGIWPAAVAVICLILHPLMIRNGTQLLPGVFSGAYILGSLFFIALCFGGRPERIGLYRSIAALFFFAAYLSKVPNLFFLPALVLGVWSIRRDRRDVAWFLGLLLILAMAEWSFYAIVKGHYYGRLATLHGHYQGVIKFVAAQLPDNYLTLGWLDLLRYRYAPRFMGGETVAYVFYAALGCATYLIARGSGLGTTKALIGYTLLSYTLINGIAIKGLDPLIPAQAFLPRYLAVLVPITIAAAILAAVDLGELLTSSKRHARNRRTTIFVRGLVVTLVGSIIVGLFLRSNADAYVFDPAKHPFAVIERYMAIVNRGISDCTLFVSVDHKSERALRRAFLYDYANLFRGDRDTSNPYAAGIATACLERYPDWQAYLASVRDVEEVDVILAWREPTVRQKVFTLRAQRVPISYLHSGLGGGAVN